MGGVKRDLWREADPARLQMVLDSMVARKVAWVPTFDIYEASRDLQRATTQPWFRDYLHPTLEDVIARAPSAIAERNARWRAAEREERATRQASPAPSRCWKASGNVVSVDWAQRRDEVRS